MSSSLNTVCIGKKRKLVDRQITLESKKMKTDNIAEMDFINFISVPSLKSILIVNVATVLFRKLDIQEKIREHSMEFDPVGDSVTGIRGTRHDRCFKELVNSILYNSSLLPLPKMLIAEVANVVRPILYQILAWIRYDRKDMEYMNSVRWTNEGTIDKIRTLKQLIDNDTGQHTHSIFKLACSSCQEESIANLWQKLPRDVKEDYLYRKRMYRKYHSHFVAYWCGVVNGQFSEILGVIKSYDPKGIYNCSDSIYKNMFSLALSQGNDLAAKYFWTKLSDVEISNNLPQWINSAVHYTKGYRTGYQSTNVYSNLLYFLICKMCIAEQKEILLKNSNVILNSLFLHWPWQRFLLPTVKLISEFIDEKVYVQLLSRIVAEIEKNKITEKLLRKLWNNSTINLKNSFIQYMLNEKIGTNVLCNLFIVEDMTTIQAILDYASTEEKKRIILSLVENNDKLFEVIYEDKFSLFDDISMSVLSELEISHVRESIVKRHGNKLCRKWLYDKNWKTFDKFLKWAFSTEDQINYFKNRIIDKIEITYLLVEQGNYELVNEFLSWCFDADEKKINEFKKYFARSKLEIVNIGSEDWHLFEIFINWCFNTEEEIKDFKSEMFHSRQMPGIIQDIIAYRSYKFELVDKLICWFCHSNDEIKQYKSEFVFTGAWMGLLERFVSNYKVYDSEWSNWELIKKLMNLFSPLDRDVIRKLKKKIANDINFDNFRDDFRGISFPVRKRDLFSLLDNDSYDIDGCEGSSSDDDLDISECSSSDDDLDISNCCDDNDQLTVQLVLSDVLNKVETDS